MNEALTVRPATPDDRLKIARIYNQYLGRATMMLTARVADDYDFFFTGNRCAALMVTVQDKPLGFAYVKPYSDRGGYVLAGEVSIFLDEVATGRGAGTRLYDTLLPAARALGYRHLTAKIFANNAGSIRFHRRYGFRMVGTQVGIGLIAGKRIDAVIMELSEA